MRAAARLDGAGALFGAAEPELRNAGLTASDVSGLGAYRGWRKLSRHVSRCEEAGIGVTGMGDDSYPGLLRCIPDPPFALYFRGNMEVVSRPCISIVGARRPTPYGLWAAAEIGGLAAVSGLTVVSGLALGTDSEAHRSALSCGSSAAVMAGGLDRVYPWRNRSLFAEIADRHCVISEYPPGVPPLAHHFPVRNRIITGLSRVTVIVQASLRSGSMVSARLALEQGREVYAVPGSIDCHASEGPNRLIHDGATPVTVPADVLYEYRDLADPSAFASCGRPAGAVGAERHGADAVSIVSMLGADGVHLDRVIERSGLDGARVMELLTALELDGLVQRRADGTYASATLTTRNEKD